MIRQAIVILALLQVGPEPKPIERARDKVLAAGFSVGYAVLPENQIACYYPSVNAIFLNTASPYWNDPDTHQLELYAIGRLSTSSRDHIIRHEIGHAVMCRKVGIVGMAYWASILPANPENVKTEVSEYAATNCVEFYAEVYAGLAAKKKYSDDILRQYRGMVGN